MEILARPTTSRRDATWALIRPALSVHNHQSKESFPLQPSVDSLPTLGASTGYGACPSENSEVYPSPAQYFQYFIFSNKPITIKFILVVIQQPLVHSGRDKLQFGAQLSGPNSDPVAQTKFSKTR